MKKVVLIAALIFFTVSFSFAQDLYTGASQPADYIPPKNGTATRFAPITCLPCAIDENEPIIQDDEKDTVNGGCNSNPAVFTSINVGDVYCGLTNTFTYNTASSRDTDWYKIVLTETKDLYWSVEAECEINIFIISDDGSCNFYNNVASNTNIPANTLGQTHFVCTPGTWYFWVGPSQFSGVSAGAKYQVVLSEGPPSDPWCTGAIPTLNEWGMIILSSLMAIFSFAVIRRRRQS